MARKQRGRKQESGVGAAVKTIIAILVAAGVCWGFARWADIRSVGDVWGYARYLSHGAQQCADEHGGKTWRCEKIDPHYHRPPSPLSRLAAPYGRMLAHDISMAGPDTSAVYDQGSWRHWSGAPCSTRVTVLVRDGRRTHVEKSAHHCAVTLGQWVDPWSHARVSNPSSMDVEPLIPLSYAAVHGARTWSPAQKERFANDTSQLVAVSHDTHQARNHAGPASWMPANDVCHFSQTWIMTAHKYHLSLSGDDKGALKKGLESCR